MLNSVPSILSLGITLNVNGPVRNVVSWRLGPVLLPASEYSNHRH